MLIVSFQNFNVVVVRPVDQYVQTSEKSTIQMGIEPRDVWIVVEERF